MLSFLLSGHLLFFEYNCGLIKGILTVPVSLFSLQKHSSAKQELEQMLLVVEETDKPEIEDNIAFYDANLSGLTQELEQLKRKYQPESNLSS